MRQVRVEVNVEASKRVEPISVHWRGAMHSDLDVPGLPKAQVRTSDDGGIRIIIGSTPEDIPRHCVVTEVDSEVRRRVQPEQLQAASNEGGDTKIQANVSAGRKRLRNPDRIVQAIDSFDARMIPSEGRIGFLTQGHVLRCKDPQSSHEVCIGQGGSEDEAHPSSREALNDPQVVLTVPLNIVDGLVIHTVVGDLNVEGVDDAGGRRQDPGSPGGEVVHRVNCQGSLKR
mmetsp:Transcript_54634/g.128306  ORF Transcript_54634/g.128306 Transcript_54634/m.128306 type:complete len:229 (-) Transcript_54634:259-945(-)